MSCFGLRLIKNYCIVLYCIVLYCIKSNMKGCSLIVSSFTSFQQVFSEVKYLSKELKKSVYILFCFNSGDIPAKKKGTHHLELINSEKDHK